CTVIYLFHIVKDKVQTRHVQNISLYPIKIFNKISTFFVVRFKNAAYFILATLCSKNGDYLCCAFAKAI
ncbi:hypothetical protein CGU36_28515, partial [Pseudomonas fluorescens]